MTYAIELIVGLSLFITGLSVILNRQEWNRFISFIKTQGPWCLMMLGLGDLLFGAFIMIFHWRWYGLSAITTAIGVLFFVRGTIRLLFPQFIFNRIFGVRDFLLLIGIFVLLIASFVLYGLTYQEFFFTTMQINLF